MDREIYQQTQEQLLVISRAVLDMPLREFIEAAERADALGPILDPTLWQRGQEKLAVIVGLARGLRDFKRSVLEALPGAMTIADLSQAQDGPTTSTDEVYEALDAGLSAREAEVLRLAATGKRNKEIARELGLAEQTVRHTMSAIYEKIGTANRVEAVLWAVKRGLVEV